MEYLSVSTSGMLCSHSVRAGPLSRYADRGSAVRDTRSQPVPAFLLRRKRHADSSERPMTSPNTALSRCQPIPAPASYSVTRTCWSRSGGMPREVRRSLPQGEQEGREIIGLPKFSQIEIVLPPIGYHPPFADVALELELSEWKLPDPVRAARSPVPA